MLLKKKSFLANHKARRVKEDCIPRYIKSVLCGIGSIGIKPVFKIDIIEVLRGLKYRPGGEREVTVTENV